MKGLKETNATIPPLSHFDIALMLILHSTRKSLSGRTAQQAPEMSLDDKTFAFMQMRRPPQV